MQAQTGKGTTAGGVIVDTVDIKGKAYVTVAERIKVATALEHGYEIISEETVEIAGRWFVRVTGLVNGKRSIGTAEIKFKAPANSAAGMAPYEDAQTSAVGRLLGLQGVGVLEGVASADEMRRAGHTPTPAASSAVASSSEDQSGEASSEDPSPAQAQPAKAAPSLAKFLEACKNNLHMDASQVMQRLGVKTLSGLDLRQAYQTLQQSPKTQTPAA